MWLIVFLVSMFSKEFYVWVGKDTAPADIQCLFGVANYESIPEDMVSDLYVLVQYCKISKYINIGGKRAMFRA